MDVDGWVTIGTDLDTKELEQKLKDSKRKLKQYEQEANNLTKQKAKIDIDLSAYEKEKQQIKEATDLTLQQAQTTEQTNAIIEQETFELNQLNQKYSETFLKNENINRAIAENVNQQRLLNNEITETNSKLASIKGLESIKNQISDVVKSVGKWALAIFSVRSAYSLIRNAISTLSQYNEKMANDIQYMRFALANALKPIIEWIIKACYTVLKLIGQIIYLITGINIFKSSGVDDFNKGLNSANKSIGKMKKQLAGFDEMNILQDDSSTSVGGGGGGIDLSLPDLSKEVENVGALTGKVQELTNKFLDTRKAIKESLGNPDLFKEAFGNFDLLVYGATEVVNGINDVFFGIIQSIGGILDIVVGIFTLNGDLIIQGIISVVDGIGNIFYGLISVVGGIFDSIVGTIKGILLTIGSWIYEHVIVPIGGFFSTLWGNIKEWATNAMNGIKSAFSPFVEFFKGIVSGVKKLFSGDLTGALNDFKTSFKNVFESLWEIAKAPLNLVISGINSIIKGANKINIKIPDWVPGVGGKKFGINIPTIPKLAKGAILNQPGRGVPVGGAIAGEAGREGYLPLTDAQVMAQLGSEIGKNVVIELTNITKLDNRIISREQKRINTQNDFAFNR